MYKLKREKQITFTDFNPPQGLQMNPNNRWVKNVAMMPWDTIELEYIKLFSGHTSMPAKPLRTALGSSNFRKRLSKDVPNEFNEVIIAYNAQ